MPAGSVVTVTITDAAGVEQTLSTVVDAAGGFSIRPEIPLADGTYGVTARTPTPQAASSRHPVGAIDTVATIGGGSLADVNAVKRRGRADQRHDDRHRVGGGRSRWWVSDADLATLDVTVTALINPDGSYSTTADLSGLTDGPLSVTVSASRCGWQYRDVDGAASPTPAPASW